MSTENTLSPAADSNQTAADLAQTPVTEKTEPTTTADVAEAKPEKSAEQKELEYLRRKATKADRNNARLYQEREEYRSRLEALEKSAPKTETEKVQYDPREIERVVNDRAEQIAQSKRMSERINRFTAAGNRDVPNFDEMTNAIHSEVPLTVQDGKASPLLEALLEMDSPALVEYLGKNLDVTAELADLSPIQLARRLDKIEREMRPVKQPANTPKPLEPVTSKTSPSEPDPDKDPTAWIAMRNKREQEKYKR